MDDRRIGPVLMTGIIGAVGVHSYTPVVTATAAISAQSVSDYEIGTATALYTISNTGTVQDQNGSVLEAWNIGGGSVSDYEVMASIVSGTLTGGSAGSWLSCSSSRSWYLINSRQNNSTVTTVLSVSIRRVSDSVVLTTATITLSAESDNSL